MVSTHENDTQEVHSFHEQVMARGQQAYFTLDPRGELTPAPDQRLWLAMHLRKAIRLLKLGPDEIFVDLGCGEGYLTQSVASRARHSVGLDFSLRALDVLRNRPSFDACCLSLILASASAVPLRDASVDKLLCNHMLEHVLDDNVVVENIRRVLRPAGRALIGVPLTLTPQTELTIRLRRLLRPGARRLQLESVVPGQLVPTLIGKQSHIRFYSYRSICALLERHGLRVLRAEGVGLAVRGPLPSRLRRSPLLLRVGALVGRILPCLSDGVLVLVERL